MHHRSHPHALALVTTTLATVALGVFAAMAPSASPPPAPKSAPIPVPGPVLPHTWAEIVASMPKAHEPAIDDDAALTPVRATKGPVTMHANARARFKGIHKSPGCWFFSGPAPIGRDHQYGESARLETNGKQVTLRFAGAAFTGDTIDGRVHLERATKNGDDGWRVSETISGSLRDGVLVGRYLYRECALDESGTCALGATSEDHCRIQAFLHVDAD